MSMSSDLRIIAGQKAVTTAGTREPLATGEMENVRVRSVTIRANTGNSNPVYVGNSTVSSTTGYILSPGETVTLQVEAAEWLAGGAINLSSVMLDVGTDGDGVSFIAVRE
jgi:hypothetical protein